MDEGVRRITGTRLIDHDGTVLSGDFLLNPDGSFVASRGDEDVVETIDGSTRSIIGHGRQESSPSSWTRDLPI